MQPGYEQDRGEEDMTLDECTAEARNFVARHPESECTVLQYENGDFEWFLGRVDAPHVLVHEVISGHKSKDRG